MKRELLLGLWCAAACGFAGPPDRMPDGSTFRSWEQPLRFSRTYYVDGQAAGADDSGPGTKERPFRTIGKAAQILQPGERVVIAAGVYRECVRPARGGSGPSRMIGYEAAPGAKVVVKGSVALKQGWKPSTGWAAGRGDDARPHLWQIEVDGNLFGGYNPFGMVNVLHDRYWLNYKVIDMTPYFRRRGMVFVDGKPLEQVDMYRELAGDMEHSLSAYSDVKSQPLFTEMGGAGGKFWVEHNGLTLHIRLPGDDNPDQHTIEITTKEQVFAPAERYLGYIRVKGIRFEHAGNGFPVPQRGLVSTNRGHHWIIEDNTIEWANAVGLDVGNEDWNASPPDTPVGHHIIRRNNIRYSGICGLAGPGTDGMLVDANLIEWAGWQNAQRMWESSGVKFHNTLNMLFRANVIRHIRHGTGIWLDVGNRNCRLTRNVFADITTVSAAIQIEGTHHPNLIDRNIIWDIRKADANAAGGGSGIFIQGTDYLTIAHNLVARCATSGIYADTVETRLLLGRGGTARENRVLNNLVADCGRSAVEFANPHNQAEGNFYAGMPQGFLRVLSPPPPQWLDLETWRRFYGWDKLGATGEMEAQFSAGELTLTLAFKGEIPKLPAQDALETDFFGVSGGPRLCPGPFVTPQLRQRSVDPRTVAP